MGRRKSETFRYEAAISCGAGSLESVANHSAGRTIRIVRPPHLGIEVQLQARRILTGEQCPVRQFRQSNPLLYTDQA